MDLGDKFDLEHLLFVERTCRVCDQRKNLIEDFYLTRKDRGSYPSLLIHMSVRSVLRRESWIQ